MIMITIVVMMQLLSFNFWSLLGWESFIIFRPHTFSQDLDTHRCCYKFFIFSQGPVEPKSVDMPTVHLLLDVCAHLRAKAGHENGNQVSHFQLS